MRESVLVLYNPSAQDSGSKVARRISYALFQLVNEVSCPPTRKYTELSVGLDYLQDLSNGSLSDCNQSTRWEYHKSPKLFELLDSGFCGISHCL